MLQLELGPCKVCYMTQSGRSALTSVCCCVMLLNLQYKYGYEKDSYNKYSKYNEKATAAEVSF